MSEPRAYTGNEIAIVGMAGRFPGARTLAEFWRNLETGVESIRPLTDDELLAAGAKQSELDDPNYVKAAAILDDMEWWDAPFWGFTPLDASIMDPQHRLFLECSWEALEDAGHAPEAFSGSVGVFAGCGMQAYMSYNLLPNRKLMDGTGLFLVRHTGNDKDFLSTRVSYQMNLRGPSVNVQTACSTSLVAMHMASQSLLSGECDMALAGGVTVELPHRVGYTYKENEILSPDGHCRSFDAASKGTVFGSGAGVVVLRRLEDAVRDGDRIHAVIRGSAINNDGSNKVGYLAPSVDGQAASIVEALSIAGVSPETVTYVETHGTGTPVGDPIEVSALTQAFRTGTEKSGFCGIGSLKSNIGHLDTAAGVASILKTVLAMKHRKLPPSLHFEQPNPLIDFASSPFYVNASLKEWTSPGPRRAGVSSLGVGGTNAHIVLEEAEDRRKSGPSRPWQLLTVSARTKSALDTASANLADHLDAHPEIPLADAAYTLTVGRHGLKERRIVAARTAEEARRLLDTQEKEHVFSDTSSERATAAFMFAGGGAQFAGMGAELYANEPVYKAAVDQCLQHLDAATAREVRSLLLPAAGDEDASSLKLEQPSLALPALFSTQYAMAKLLESWGIVPEAMIGHSMGEYTAAHLAGVFSLKDAVRLVALRGRLFEKVPAGAMLSVPLSEADLLPLLGDELSLAAVNAPELTLASGPVAAIEALQQKLAAKEVDAKRLRIAVAAHSAMLEPILQEFGAYFRTIKLTAPQRPFVSTESGTWITAEQATDPEYWVRHLRNTVRFADGVKELVSDPTRVLLEVGPGRVLATLARQHPERQQSQLVMTSMRAPSDEGSDHGVALTALGRLWARGVRPDWKAFWADENRNRVGLPTYPWERQRHWIEAPVANAIAAPDDTRRNRVAEWFARPAWTQSLPPAPLQNAEERVLVFSDATGFGDAVAAHLASAGRKVTTATAGPVFNRDGDRFTIRAGTAGDHAQLIAALIADGGIPSRVVYAWGVTGSETSTLDAVLDGGFHALMAFAQEVGNEDPDAAFVLDVITSDLQRIGGEARLQPAKALLLGPARVMPREFPNIRSRAIDVVIPTAASARKALAALVAAEIASEPINETIAFRGVDRYVQQLVPATFEGAASRLRDGGVYLITGGLGGIGYTLAEHLASTRKAKLVLIGRGATAARTKSKVAALEALGGEVEIVQADVTNEAQVRTAIERAKTRFGALHGVFHAAGTLGDSLIPLKTRADADRVLAPKVQGTLALDAALGAEPLDLFVLFSSISSVAGLAGQADYAAANAFLDAFAHERSARDGQYTVAVGWSAWKEVGMAAGIAAGAGAGGAVGEVIHDVLGTRIWASSEADLFAADLSVASHWMLAEHRLRGGRSLIPGTGYLEIARAAVEARAEGRPVQLRDVAFMSPFVVEDDAPRELRVHLASGSGNDRALAIAGRATSEDGSTVWQEHVTAKVGYADEAELPALDLAAIAARCTVREQQFSGAEENPHLAFGPRWKNLRRIRYGKTEAIAELELPAQFAGDLEAYRMHPALMDMATACAQALVPGLDPSRDLYVPLSYTRLTMFAPLAAKIRSYVRLAESDFDPSEIVVFDVTITDETGKVLVDVCDFMMRRVDDGAHLQASGFTASIRRTGPKFEISTAHSSQASPPALLGDAIESAEGLEALEMILAGPALSHVFVSPIDLMSHLSQMRGGRTESGPSASSDAPPDVSAVEQELSRFPGIQDVVVKPVRIRPRQWRVSAFVVYAPSGRPRKSALRIHLARLFPPHLVPTHIVELESLPRDESGDIARERLIDQFGDGAGESAPLTTTEEMVAKLWSELIGVAQPSAIDNFFELGGHSLVAIRLLARLRRATGIEQPLAALFEHPTLGDFAALYADPTASPLAPVQPHAASDEFLPSRLRLTHLQEGLWAAEQARPGTTINHVSGVRRLAGRLSLEHLRAALEFLLARHDALQLRTRVEDGSPMLEREVESVARIEVLDGSALDADAYEPVLRQALGVPFDLEHDAPVRVTVLRIADDDHLLLLSAHHLLVDGNSLSVLWHDLLAAYRAFEANRTPDMPPAPSFRAWALESRRRVEAGEFDAQLAYWRERLTTLPASLDLSTGDGEDTPSFEAGTVLFPLDRDLMERVERLNVLGSTPFLVVLSALQAVLSRYSGESDIAVGVPALLTAGDERLESGVGLFINTMILRTTIDGTESFPALLERNRKIVLDAWSNREFPFSLLVETLNPQRHRTRNPYFQVLLSFEQADAGATGQVGGLSLARYEIERTGTQAELAFYVRWMKEGGALSIDYDASLFSKPQVERFATHVLRLLEQGLANTQQGVGELDFLATAERRLLVEGRNATTRLWRSTTTVALVAAQAIRVPDRVAVSQAAARLKYEALWSRSGTVAAALRRRGCGAESIVGVSVERSPEMLVALLGIWRAGGAYLPLDPAFPADRLAFMVADAGCTLVVRDESGFDPGGDVAAVSVSALEQEGSGGDPADPLWSAGADGLAYVLYTSGSTGRPKGVEVSHGALANFLQSMAEAPGLGTDDVLLAVTTLSFDIAGLELWLPLSVGARVELARAEDARDPEPLIALLVSSGATVMQATPATWRMLLDAGWQGSLQQVWCGGEAFPRELVTPLRERGSAVWNFYGPTETTIWSTVYRLGDETSETTVPIGLPIANTRVYVMDRSGQLAAPGVPGELWIGGAGVARGYRGRPELTTERFVADPFDPGSAVYRTGDSVRWTPAGVLEHLGRLDHQVKINGFRIELGEIESLLAQAPAVRQAVVDVRGNDGDRRLVAYVVLDSTAHAKPSATEIRRALRQQLPDYMVPGVILFLEAVPLTPNGKVDRRALPDPFADASRAKPDYEAPAPGVETTIAAVWTELLQLERVGRHDNFFELGGHSLLALQAVWRLRRDNGLELDARVFFFNTLAQMADGIK